MTSKVKMLVLSLTGKCNFNCRYCYASEHERICMSREIALAALKLAPRDECFVLQFSGGEPLLNFKHYRQWWSRWKGIICPLLCKFKPMAPC